MWSYFLFAMTVVVITKVESGGVSTYPSGYAYGLPPGSFQYPGPHTPSVTDYSYPQWPPGGYGSQKPPKPPLPNITLPTDQQPTPGAPTDDTRPTGNGPPPVNGEAPSRPATPQQPPYWPPWGTSEYPSISGQYKPKPGFPNGQQPGLTSPLPSLGGGGYYPQWPGPWQQKPPKPIVLPQPPPQTTNITGNGQVQPPYPQYPYWPPGANGGQYKPKPQLPQVPDWRYPQPVPGQFPQWPGYGQQQQKPPKAPVAPPTNFTGNGQPQPFPGAPTISQLDWRYGYPQYGAGAGYGGQPQVYWPYGSGVPAPGGGYAGYGQQKPKPIGAIPGAGAGVGTGYWPYPSGPYPGGVQQPTGVSAKPPRSLYPWGGGYSQPTGYQYGYGQPVAQAPIQYPASGAGQYYPGYGYGPQYQYPSTGYVKDKSGSKYG